MKPPVVPNPRPDPEPEPRPEPEPKPKPGPEPKPEPKPEPEPEPEVPQGPATGRQALEDAVVETARAYARKSEYAVYSDTVLTKLGKSGSIAATWNIAPKEIGETQKYYGTAGYLIYEVYREALGLSLTANQAGMDELQDLIDAYGVDGGQQSGDIVVVNGTGLDGCPRLIDYEDFAAVQAQRTERNTYSPLPDQVWPICGKLVCAKCGGRMARGSRSHGRMCWKCQSEDCVEQITVGDEVLTGLVDRLLRKLAKVPHLLTAPESALAAPDIETVRLQNELTLAFNRGGESIPYIKTLAMAVAAQRYSLRSPPP